MSAPRDPDLIIADWLDDGPLRLPDQTRRAIAVGLRSTSQRRSIVGRPWRSDPMSPFLKLAGAALAVVLVAAVSVSMLGTRLGIAGFGAAPAASPTSTVSPSPSPSPVASLSAVIGTTDWTPSSSARYGYSISLPPGWTTQGSSRDWTMSVDAPDWRSPAADRFHSADGGILLTVFSAPLVAGLSADTWVSEYFDRAATGAAGACTQTAEDLGRVSVQGHPASVWTETKTATCGGTYAFVPVGGRMYAFIVWLTGEEPLLKAFLSTVRLDQPAGASVLPSDAAVLGAAGWTPYHSDRYGFDIGVPPDWTIEPAEHTWTYDEDATDFLSHGQEAFVAPDRSIRVSAWAVPLDAGTTLDTLDFETWAATYCERSQNTPCTGIHDRGVPLCIERRDCHPSLLVPFTDDVQAFFTGGIYDGASMFVVAVWRGEAAREVAPYGGSEQLLEDVLSTMSVWPVSTTLEERQVRPAPAPASP